MAKCDLRTLRYYGPGRCEVCDAAFTSSGYEIINRVDSVYVCSLRCADKVDSVPRTCPQRTGLDRERCGALLAPGDSRCGDHADAGGVIRSPRLACGCPIDSGCTGYHTDGTIGGAR